MKIYNFSAGPSILPQVTIDKTAEAVKNFNGIGLSILEISHRSKDFQAVMDEAVALFKELLDIPEGYSVLFLGGAKSTLSRALALGLGLTGKRKFVLVVCATQDAANRAVTDMAGLITEQVVKLYPWAASPTVASTLLVRV